MANRIRLVTAARRILMLMALLAAPRILSAEEGSFEQRIEWKADAAALEYTVEVQRAEGGEISSYSTENTYLDLSLTVGSYRYRVHAIDFLGRDSAVSEWRTFEVFRAATPEIDVIQETVTYTSDDRILKLPVVILNINRQSTVELVNIATGTRTRVTVALNASSGGKDSPASEVFRSSAVTVPVVEEGVWYLSVRNPSGLTARSASMTFVKVASSSEQERAASAREEQVRREAEEAARKRFEEEAAESGGAEPEEPETQQEPEVVEVLVEDTELLSQKDAEIARLTEELSKRKSVTKNMQAVLSLGAAFSPYDGSLEELTGMGVIPQAAFRLTVLPVRSKTGHIRTGMEFSAVEVLAPVFNDYLSSFLSMTLVNAALVYQVRLFTDSLALSFKAGGGTAVIAADAKYLSDYSERTETSLQWRVYFEVTAGLSVVWKPASHFLMEAGADAAYVFSASMPTLAITPYIGVGIHW